MPVMCYRPYAKSGHLQMALTICIWPDFSGLCTNTNLTPFDSSFNFRSFQITDLRGHSRIYAQLIFACLRCCIPTIMPFSHLSFLERNQMRQTMSSVVQTLRDHDIGVMHRSGQRHQYLAQQAVGLPATFQAMGGFFCPPLRFPE